ncbi:L-asparaginase [Paractinoplanes rishiriensis]|uniref:L-asparaginase n=1 Tax=Paractinoplanes rishiriensis TaxID=1050105 RepID=A0A919K5Z4_9ACTN|nr:asparaginase [Actinoplanes rishiriensis]GIE97241.1 L-asparaginase [Actinoplanes rishiriensis]
MSARVLLVGLGGTIATAAADGMPSLTAQQLVSAVPGLDATGIELDVRDLRNLPGASLGFDDLAELVRLIRAASVTGVVVTQGTDTIEETAYLLDLLHDGAQPVVVTGAMRNASLAGADGPANILAAVRVAASPQARDLGCLVVMADEIHAAARVRKTHATSLGAFTSANGGPLGYVSEGTVRIVQRPVRREAGRGLPEGGTAPRVGLIVATLGDDGSSLPVLAEGLDGLVVAGFGVGHVPATWVEHLAAVARRIPVVLASRTGAGFVATATYGFAGSERDLISNGLLAAGGLDAYKARLLLLILLWHGVGRAEITEAFGRT